MSTTYEKKINEPWFSLMKLKIKTVEGTLNKGDFSNMKIGDIIIFKNYDLGFQRRLGVKIIKITNYDTFQLYLENETLDRCLPTIDTMDEGLDVYNNIYKQEDIKTHTVKAFTITKLRQ